MDAMTKDGMVTPIVATAMTSMSCHLPFFTAARIPIGIEARTTKMIVMPPSFPDTGKPLAIKSLTVFPVNL